MNREIIGLLIGSVTLILVYISPLTTALGVVILSVFMAYELFKSLGINSAHIFVPIIALASWYNPVLGIFLSLLLCFIYGYGSWNLEVFFRVFFVSIYSGVLPALLIHIREEGLREAIALLLTIWAVDVTAYYIGKKFGSSALAPKLSPNKTIEGFVAGLIASIIVFTFVSDKELIESLVIGMLLGLSASIGDLLKSYIKRQLDIKDFSNVLGEHGGFVDRFDSLVFTATLYYCILL